MKYKTLKLTLFLGACTFSLPSMAIETQFENDPSLPIVYLNVGVKGGAANDPDGQSGISNFVGEMMLRGTKTRSKAQIDEALDQLGATLGVETRSEALIFRGRVLSSKLAEYMDIVQDIITNPSFPEKEIKKLKSEITSELMESRGNDKVLGRLFWESFLFEGHPYGKPILGKSKEIEKLKRDDLLKQYGNLFQDRNLLVIGSGDSQPSTFSSWAKKLAEKRPNSPGENPIRTAVTPSAPVKRTVQFIDKPDRTQTQLYFGQIGLLLTDPDYFSVYLANHVFGGGSFSARMMTEVRVKRGWSYGAGSFFRHGIRARSWQAYTFPASKDTPGTLSLIDTMIRDFREKGITSEEYKFARDSLINSAGFTYNTPGKRVENLLLEKTLGLPDGFMKSYAENLAKTTQEGVNTSVKNFLKPDEMKILVLGTAKDLKAKVAGSLKIPENEIKVIPYTKE